MLVLRGDLQKVSTGWRWCWFGKAIQNSSSAGNLLPKVEKHQSRRTKFSFLTRVSCPNPIIIHPFVYRPKPSHTALCHNPFSAIRLLELSFLCSSVCPSQGETSSWFIHRPTLVVQAPPFVHHSRKPSCFTRYPLEWKYCSQNGNCFLRLILDGNTVDQQISVSVSEVQEEVSHNIME